ncbi:hypothetical protein [Actinomadura alba]|uniref:Lipoprotein n=1 Tax=Actinomadura alba TaxID=406431 RepID=A0ABR7LKJ0_9ACTN|nr:hypothetical protein [Actinomadura alba]MBC6465198.1 hypothetical protein [Actinomadura alba]
MTPSRTHLILVMIAAAVLAGGCAGTPKHTITAQKALERVDGHLRSTLSAVAGGLRFSGRETDTDDGSSCTKAMTGSGFTGQVQAQIEYTASPVTADAAGRFLDSLGSHWKSRSHDVTRTGDHIGAYTDRDNYFLAANYNPERRELRLSGSSECVWRDGTPRPGDDP